MELKTLCKEAHEISKSHGFWNNDRYNTLPTKLMLIVRELAECCENDRIGSSKIGEELADTVIRICDLAEYLKIDLDMEIIRKMKINEKRKYLHGKRY